MSQAEVLRLVESAKRSGLIRGRDPIHKDGELAVVEGGLRTVWIDVTPAIAARWLEENFKNRPVSWTVVEAFAREMANGLWRRTHQGMGFNDRDELIDGQHRLHAIIRTGKTIRVMVTFGLPAEIEGSEVTTMDVIDRGRPRSVADQLKIQHGLKDGRLIAAVCMSLGALCSQRRTRRLSVGEVLQIFRTFETSILHAVERRPEEHGLKAAGVLAAFAFAMAVEDSVTGLFEQLRTGRGLRPMSAIAALRGFLTSDAARLLNRGTDRGLAELVLQAIWQELNDVDVARLEQGLEGAAFFRVKQTERVASVAALFELAAADPGGVPAIA